jgi:hypothetical protein
VERTGAGEGARAQGIGVFRHINDAIHGKAPCDANESTGTARYDIVFDNMNMGGGLPRGGEYPLSIPKQLRRDTVSVGCLEGNLPGRALRGSAPNRLLTPCAPSASQYWMVPANATAI